MAGQRSDPPDGFAGVEPASAMPPWYRDLLGSVSQHISTGRRRAVAAVTNQLVLTYWHVGREILDRQDAEGYGTKVIDRLSIDLKRAFPDATGFSPRNLKYMRAFAAAWPDLEVVQGPLAQVPWYHQIALLDKLDDPALRTWYATETVAQGWSRNVLAHQIDSRLHERTGRAITNFADTLPPEQSDLAQQATKDPYLFDFLGVTEPRLERDLERQLMDHVSEFLLELGQGFALLGRQVRLTLGGDEFFCDLLFYHVRLHCYVVVELKGGTFKPDYLGQLGLYIAAVDDLMAGDGDAPTVGLLLCRTKNSVVAEYALSSQKAPIGVAEWASRITDHLPDELAASLPSIETLEAELSDPPDAT